MTIKLNSLARWQMLAPGGAIELAHTSDSGRRVRLHVNCAAPTTFYVEDADGPRLLAAVPAGLETIEFSAAGNFAVFAGEGSGEVHYQTAEGEPTFARVVDPVIFTKLAQRRHRNPEIEEVMMRMQANMERRFALQANEIALALARRDKEKEIVEPVESVEPKAKSVGKAAGSGSVPAPVHEPEEPAAGEGAGGEGES
jgi:hypothetical protein